MKLGRQADSNIAVMAKGKLIHKSEFGHNSLNTGPI